MSDVDLQRLERKIDQTLAQTTLTNGRVTALERTVYGSQTHNEPGMRADLREIRQIVMDARAVLRFGKWAVVATPILAFAGAAFAAGAGL